jgi:hypothetical protein
MQSTPNRTHRVQHLNLRAPRHDGGRSWRAIVYARDKRAFMPHDHPRLCVLNGARVHLALTPSIEHTCVEHKLSVLRTAWAPTHTHTVSPI